MYSALAYTSKEDHSKCKHYLIEEHVLTNTYADKQLSQAATDV